MKYYFVDHDNNPKECTKAFESVDSGDIVFLYYTDASKYMDMNMFEYFDNSEVNYDVIHITNKEKEAIDNRIKFDVIDLFQKKKNHDFEIYVVSKDKGYKSFESILLEKFDFDGYYCVTDFSRKPVVEQKVTPSKEKAKKPTNATTPKKSKNTQNVLTNEVVDHLKGKKGKLFDKQEIHEFLQQKHKNDKQKFTLSKYGFKTIKQLMKTVLAEGAKTKGEKYYWPK